MSVTRFEIGDRVARKDAPGVEGTVIALRGGTVKVYWSTHTSVWTNPAALTRAKGEKHPRIL